MKQGQYPPVSRNGNAVHKRLVRFYALGACWHHLIEPAKVLKVTVFSLVRIVIAYLLGGGLKETGQLRKIAATIIATIPAATMIQSLAFRFQVLCGVAWR